MFRFWARIVLALVLALAGFFLAGLLGQPRLVYSLLGVLISILIFARVSTWVVLTTTRVARQFITRLASEVVNQVVNLTSAGLTLLPGSATARKNPPAKLSSPLILDTSAIIDGRILDVAKSGFLSGIVILPNFVLTELQQVADSQDSLKRGRGRRGFEVVEGLKDLPHVKLEVWDRQVRGKSVDEKLVRLGKVVGGRVLTVDFNLNKVSTLAGVQVLNINELANALKTVALPGEKLGIKVIHVGKDRSQGVGYLEDGTMVVVENGASLIGRQIEVEVTRTLQVPTGRMVFARLSA